MKASIAMSHANDNQKKEFEKIPTLQIDAFSAYQLTDQGTVEDIVDHDYHFVKGDYLDSLSDILNERESKLDDIIYGKTD